MNPGDRLGPYEVVSRIGAGGMGEVWRARDKRLERSVAIKILPRELAGNAELRIRFEREAKTISQLNHPHICTLHDFGHENGIDFLVMELLEGDSLAERIARGPMPTADVLRYGSEIAEALHRAHRAGVVHRDLKPGNVVITRSGAKLLDFGLAKPMPSATMTFNSRGDTERIDLTEKGIVMGTFQYMAPEQIAGEIADTRTDIFSFGTVLYEMTTGTRPFQGSSKTSLIAAIITAEPRPASQLMPHTPPALEHLIAKCLCKDPEDRWQSAHDIAQELRWIAGAGSQATSLGTFTAKRSKHERLVLIAALIVAVAMAAVAGWLALRPRALPDAIEAAIATDGNGGLQYGTGPPSISPDGKTIAYAAADANGGRVLWLRSIDSGTAKPLAGTSEAATPFWSPDGRFLGFSVGGRLKKIAVSGGDAETIAVGATTACSWSRDDVILFTTNTASGAIFRVAASGGDPAIVIVPAAVGATTIEWPSFLPDGKHFLFVAFGGPQAGVWAESLDGKEKPRFVTRASSNVRYVEPGYLLFASEGLLRAQRFDAKSMRVEGEPVTIAPVQSYGRTALFAASSSLLLYQPPGNTQASELVLKNRAGAVVRRVGDSAFYFAPRVSPDGHRIAVDRSDDKGSGDIWLLGTDGAASRFSFESRNETAPVWSPRGDEVAYRIDVAAGSAILRKRIGEGPQTVVDERRGGLIPTEWSPDGRYLAAARPGSGPNADLSVWAFDEKKWIDVASTPSNETNGTFAPDGKWIAFQSDESGRYEIYVQPFPPTGAKYQLSTGGGTSPRWLRNGEIVFVDAQNRIESIRVTTTPAFQAGAPEVLFPIELRDLFTRQWDALPDGTFLINAPVKNQPRPMTLLVNWQRRL